MATPPRARNTTRGMYMRDTNRKPYSRRRATSCADLCSLLATTHATPRGAGTFSFPSGVTDLACLMARILIAGTSDAIEALSEVLRNDAELVTAHSVRDALQLFDPQIDVVV